MRDYNGKLRFRGIKSVGDLVYLLACMQALEGWGKICHCEEALADVAI